MELFIRRLIRRGATDYRIELHFDPEALDREVARFQVNALTKEHASETWTDVSVDIEVSPADRQVQILYRGHSIASLSLDIDLPESSEYTVDLELDENVLDEAMGLEAVEDLIQLVPTDPFIGCLVKDAVSTTVGQLIRCWRHLQKVRPYRELARKIGGCIYEFRDRMLYTFLWRAGKCVVKFSF